MKTFRISFGANRNDSQNKRAKIRAKIFFETLLLNVQCIFKNDETIAKSNFKQLPEEDFTAENLNSIPEKWKVKKLPKFPRKVLIWQVTFCSCDLRSKMFVISGIMN